jgi:hypothetical protein
LGRKWRHERRQLREEKKTIDRAGKSTVEDQRRARGGEMME